MRHEKDRHVRGTAGFFADKYFGQYHYFYFILMTKNQKQILIVLGVLLGASGISFSLLA
jgi:hypothetical protein